MKRLHLKGFKSFADTTDILFKPGVNVLVGPNGCGKSNVVDALRWVLGSSRNRELRAQKQEDIIFNGAEGVRPQNLARVEMILDNQDGTLPLEYSEVGVSRKLFRSGETEFHINQSKVRLKDIGELFTDTGIGKQGYAVIGQGEVEAVLTGKPWDRRMMIEEAAGMIRYRQEREDVLRRLIHSQNDGVRLQDILTELEERLSGLQIKADKARQYTTLRTERRERLEQVLTAEIRQRYQKTAERRQQTLLLKEQIEKGNEQLAAIEQQERELAVQIEQVQAGEQRAFDQLEEKENRLREQKNQNSILQERLRHCGESVAQLQNEIHQNRQQVTRIAPDVVSRREDYEKLRREIASDRDALKVQEQGCQQMEEQLVKEQAALSLEQRQMVEQQLSAEALSQELEEKRQRLFALREEKKYQELRLTEQRQQADEEEKRLQEYEQLLTQGQTRLSEEERRQQQWTLQLQENRRRYEDEKQLTSENEKTANRLKNQIQLLQQMMENHALHSDSVRRLLLAVERGELQLPGLLGGVSELIETPASLALAIETALGGALDHLVTRTAEDASRGISYLRQIRGGRATFLPLDNLRYQPLSGDWKQKISTYRGVVGIASELISCEEAARPALEYLLGRTVVTETLEDGLKVFRGIRQSIRIVSLEGDVVNAGGTMTGGSKAANRSGILARKAQKQQLQQEWKEALKIWQESIRRFEQTEGEWRRFQEEGEALRRGYQEQLLKNQNTEESLRQQKQKQQEILLLLKETEAGCQRLEETLHQQEQSFKELEKNLTAHREALHRQEEASGSRQDGYQELQKSCSLLKERIKALKEQLQMKRQESAAREAYWKQLKEIQDSYEAAAEAAGEQLRQKRQERETLQGEIQTLQTGIADQEAEVREQVRVLDGWQEQLEAIQEQNGMLQAALQPVKQQLEKDLRGLHEKQLQQVRLEAELESWQEKWQQEFGSPWQDREPETGLSASELKQHQSRVNELDEALERLGDIDPGAIQEYEEHLSRYTFLKAQLEDLNQAHQKLMQLLNETEWRIDRQFGAFYEQLQQKFNETFQRIFSGGQARLEMEQEETDGDALMKGVEIVVQMPGKKVQNLMALSGGEKALTGIAFVFALLNLKNAPFCVMDEIDAPLDEANLARFIEFVRQMSQETQFIIISHRQATIASGEVIYGITMARRGISRVLSLNLEQAQQLEQAYPHTAG